MGWGDWKTLRKSEEQSGHCEIRGVVLNLIHANCLHCCVFDDGINTNSRKGSHDDRAHQ